MEIILLEHVEKLGKMGDIVNVKSGYARNYLLPQNKALRATDANKAVFEKQKAELEAHNKALFDEVDEELRNEAQILYEVGLKRIGLYIALGYYKGNCNNFSFTEAYTVATDRIYDQDLKKAYKLFDELIDEHAGDKKDYYLKIKEEIKETLKKKGIYV